jgi:hydrogenase maturation protease
MTRDGRIVMGIGNAFRGDDGAGLAVAACIRGRMPVGAAVVPCEREPARLLDAWEGSETALVIDAVKSGAKPGTVHRFDAADGAIPGGLFRPSTHAFGLGDAIELARALGRLPPHVVVYGIEGAAFGTRVGLTPPVAAAVQRVADAVLDDLERLASEEEPCTSGP